MELFYYRKASVDEANPIKKVFTELGFKKSPELNALKTFGMSWNTEFEPGPITQCECLTSLDALVSE